MQFARVSFVNSIGQFIIKLTNWLVLPLQSLLPRIKSFDLPSLAAAFLCSFAHFVILWLLTLLQSDVLVVHTYSFMYSFLILLWLALLNLAKLMLYLLIGIILINTVFSWLQPSHMPPSPMRWLVQHLSTPLLAPIQRRVKSYNGLDFSPLIALVILQVLLIVVAELMS